MPESAPFSIMRWPLQAIISGFAAARVAVAPVKLCRSFTLLTSRSARKSWLYLSLRIPTLLLFASDVFPPSNSKRSDRSYRFC